MKRSLFLNIRQKITIIFIFVIILLCVNAFIGITINHSGKEVNQQLNKIYYPLLETCKNLDFNQATAVELAQKWILSGKSEDKMILKNLINEEYSEIRVTLGKLLVFVDNKSLYNKIKKVLQGFDELTASYEEMMDMLTTRADFENINQYTVSNNILEKSIIPGITEYRGELNEMKGQVSSIIIGINKKKEKILLMYDYITYTLTGTIVIVIVILIFFIPGLILNRIDRINKSILILAEGNFPENFKTDSKDEIGKLERSLNLLNTGIQKIKDFIIDIGMGNFETKIEISKIGELGSVLEKMRDSLVEISEKQEEIRKEEELRNWINTGIAQFNEILRLKNDNIAELSYTIIKELVKYTDSVIGGVYITKKESDNLEKLVMSGLFAYERKRYVDVELSPGEGLIGTAYIEKHKIHMREIPDDYIKISSGLGEAPPNELLIVPIVYNDSIFGVLEMATLNSYNEHTIKFIERIAESLASTIASVITNTETARLLAESNEKAERLYSQEEELRQNMEELEAAQEEKNRQTKYLEDVQQNLETIIENFPFPVFVKDENSKYILVNDEQCKLFGIMKDSFIGRSDENFIKDPKELLLIKNSDIDVLQNNKKITLPEQNITTSAGKKYLFRTIKIPIENRSSKKTNILGISYDISQIKNMEVELQKAKKIIEEFKTVNNKK